MVFSELYELVVNRDVRPERPEDDEAPGLSDAVWDVAEACWTKNPRQRPTAGAASEKIAQIIKENTLSSFGGLAIRPPNPPPPTPVTPADVDGDRTARQLPPPPPQPPSVIGNRPVSPLSPLHHGGPRDANQTLPARPPNQPPPTRLSPAIPPPPPPLAPPPYTPVESLYAPVQPLSLAPRVRTPQPSSPAGPISILDCGSRSSSPSL